ncbi:MAG: TRAP transporter large permease [Elusimicrobiota bacterium]|jgi:C4-dicarboxylate transporter DctM subunit|nr:TRAP transporter large permease [Elusimicrobiota bacterium]
MTIYSILILLFLLIVLLISGVPITAALGFCALAGAFLLDIAPDFLAKRMVASLQSDALMSIPFFILVGNIMMESGISKKIIIFLDSFLGRMRGGLNYAAVAACAFFSALAGPAPLTVIAVGSVLYEQMTALGYPKERSAGLFTAAGSLGSIIPPSVIMIVYSSITKIPIKDLFTAGMGIGIILTVVYMIICLYIGKKENLRRNIEKFVFRDFVKSFISLLPAAFIPIIIAGGIYFKILTPLQAGAASSLYALLLGFFVYKTLNKEKFVRAFFNCAKNSAMILFIIIGANLFSVIFINSGLDKYLQNTVSVLDLSPLSFSLFAGFIVIAIGTVLDGAAICVFLAPAFYAIAQSLGIDGVHFAMIMCVGAVLGSMTPPVAVSIFAAKTFTKLSAGAIAKGQMPFFIGFLSVYILVIIFPIISRFLSK